MHKIAENILSTFQNSSERKIIPIEEINTLNSIIGDCITPKMENTSNVDSWLKEADKGYLAYLEMFEHLYIFTKVILSHNTLIESAKKMRKYEEDYIPQGPPVSPITPSYFDYWKIFDLQIDGSATIGDLFVDLAPVLEIPEHVQNLVEGSSQSRVQLYKQLSESDQQPYIHLKEIGTNEVVKVYSPSKCRGERNELWLASVLPPVADADYGVMITTPYLLKDTKEDLWLDYFRRQGIDPFGKNCSEQIYNHFKFPGNPTYWFDYIVDAFSSVCENASCIYLTGYPDIPESLPHRHL